jgi:hypothetical protein
MPLSPTKSIVGWKARWRRRNCIIRLAPKAKPNTAGLKPYLRVFRGVSKGNLSGYVEFFQFLRNFRQQNAFEQAELSLRAVLDPAIATRARRGRFVKCLDHFDLLQIAIN